MAISGHRQPTLAAIAANPTLHPRAFALVNERFPQLKWHGHADSPDSSQSFALSAFVPVLEFPQKNLIIDAFVTTTLPSIPRNPDREWSITPEFTAPELLGETGAGIPTCVDILLSSHDAVVCVESKYRVDALEGFGRCSQFTSGTCRGYYGEGSDTKGTPAFCRLSVKDWRRNARLYWELGKGHFRDSVFVEQSDSDACPYRDNYQAMRNYLLASRLANTEDKPYFGVIALVPSARDTALGAGVTRFQSQVLRPESIDGIAIAHYESYVNLLAAGSNEAVNLARFLSELLA